MAIKYLKKAIKTPSTDDHKTREIVQNILDDIEKRREEGIKEVTKKFDNYEGDIIVSKEKIEEASKKVNQKTKDDIQFAYERVRKFAEHQLKSMNNNFEVELSDGLFAGQRLIPVDTAGCYIPGGRYAHISSAVMAITPAKVAGVRTIICASPPKDANGANAGIIYAANLCGADVILNLGGIAAIASMTYGCFDNPPVDFLVGAGNQYVAEAKRIVYGKVGIDQFAGDTNEEMAKISDQYASEHLEVHAENLDWWLNRLRNYGSLFLGEETTVAYGDKCSGTNHILPTKGGGRYTGGLFVGKFIKTLTFQRMTKDANKIVGATAARLARAEGMEAHARTGDIRLKKYGHSS